MRRLILVLGCLIVVATAGCSNPKNLKITEKNKTTFMEDLKDSRAFTVGEVQLMNAYLIRRSMADAFMGDKSGKDELPLVGKTVGEIIEIERTREAKEKSEEERQKKLVEEEKAKQSAIASELRKCLTLAVCDKEFIPSDATADRFEDRIAFSVIYENTSAKKIRAFQGSLVFEDLFGDEVTTLNLKVTDPVNPGDQIKWEGSTDYNQFSDSDVKFKNLELKDLKAIWNPERIIFDDGTTIPADAAQK